MQDASFAKYLLALTLALLSALIDFTFSPNQNKTTETMINIQTGNKITLCTYEDCEFASYTERVSEKLVLTIQWTFNRSIGIITNLDTGEISLHTFENSSCLDDALSYDAECLAKKYFPHWHSPQILGL